MAGPVGGGFVIGFALFALMGGWWLLTCGPATAVAAGGTAVWLKLQRMADNTARLNHDTVGRLRRRAPAEDVWDPPKGDPGGS